MNMLSWANTGVKNGIWEPCFSPCHVKKEELNGFCILLGWLSGMDTYTLGSLSYSRLTPLWLIHGNSTSQIIYVLPNLETL